MKTLVCFLSTWITATALLIWVATRHDGQQIDFGAAQITLSKGTEITLTTHQQGGHIFWHSLWVAGVFSILNTFIVRFWQMQWEMKEAKS